MATGMLIVKVIVMVKARPTVMMMMMAIGMVSSIVKAPLMVTQSECKMVIVEVTASQKVKM